MKLTRRELAGIVAAIPVAATSTAAPQSSGDSPEQVKQSATEAVGKNVAAIRKLKVPATVEPAFAFKAL